MTPANLLTGGRLVLAPVLFVLLLQPSRSLRTLGFGVFVLAAVTDLWDGYLARRRGEVTDFGRLADPLADKLLLAAALIPVYLATTRHAHLAGIPVYGDVSFWIVAVLLGRELLVTALRMLAARNGQVISASRAGKYKTFSQDLFLGAAILWLAFRSGPTAPSAPFSLGDGWWGLNGWFITVTLTCALLLTVYSMAAYLARYARIVRGETA